MRLDLHNYVAIGFQPYWLKLQGYNPGTLLEETVNRCFSKEIDVCGITSKEFNIPKGSVHDRFGYMVNQTRNLPKEYKHDKLEDTALIIEKDDKKVILLNVQGVIAKNIESKRVDYLVIGDNQLKNNLNLLQSLRQLKDQDLISLIHYPLFTDSAYCGMSELDIQAYKHYFNGIITHDAQIIFPINLINYFKIKDAEILSSVKKIPQIAVSGAHRIKDIGTSYIEYNGILNLDSKEDLLNSLKIIIKNKPKKVEKSISLLAFLDWNLKFRKGLKNLDKIKDF